MQTLLQVVKQDIKALLTANLADWKKEAELLGRDHDDMYNDDMENYLELTIATNDNGDEWAFQTGDNSFTGDCYLLPHWSVNSILADTNIDELHAEIVNELESLLPDNR
jgi:hypothetical protein